MFTRCIMTLSAWLLAAFPAVVLAAEEAHGGQEAPSLFKGDLATFLWTIIIFLLVIFVLGKFAWGPLLDGLQRREKYIRDSLASAKQDREDAEKRLQDYEQKLRQAREEANSIVEEGRRHAEKLKQRIEQEARQNGDDMLERAKREINNARDSALRDIYKQSGELAMYMAGEVLKRQVTAEDHEKLMQEALQQWRDNDVSSN